MIRINEKLTNNKIKYNIYFKFSLMIKLHFVNNYTLL